MELRGITDLYKHKDIVTPEGMVIEQDILTKKNALYTIYCEPQHLGPHLDILNVRTGKPYKDRCQVYIENIGVVTVRYSAKALQEIKSKHTTGKKVGFYANKSS